MKCSKCQKPVARKGYCPKCKASYNQLWYQAHRDEQMKRVKANNLRYAEEVKKLLDAAKDVPCADCGKKYPICVMDLHHVRGKKKFTLANWKVVFPGMKAIVAEIKKCIAICSNCHRLRHCP